MAGREAFLQAIREAPEDAGLRLIFADWLDERSDPLGEFIRLQFELEPLRDCYDDRTKRLRQREEELIWDNRAAWLGPLAELFREPWEYADSFVFRRGLVEGATLPLTNFLLYVEDLSRWCPALREMTFFDIRNRGGELAGSPYLGNLRRVEIADWMTGADARALAGSPHLEGLRELHLWLGSRHDPTVCMAFARSSALPKLRTVKLIQLFGGLTAVRHQTQEGAARLDIQASRLADEVNRLRGQPIAQVHRPYERLFPLDQEVYLQLYAGWLPDGRQALVVVDVEGLLLVFDAEGNLSPERPKALAGIETYTRSGKSWKEYPQYVFDGLNREQGFQAGLIRVKEFDTDLGLSVHLFTFGQTGDLADPDSWGEDRARWEEAAGIHRWLRRGDFVIDWGDDMWAGPDGKVHST